MIQDLFPEENAIEKSKRECKQHPKRGMYHDKRGKFTDRHTAEIASYQREIMSLKKQNAILNTNFNYYKRVNKRLSEQLKKEQIRVAEWETKYDILSKTISQKDTLKFSQQTKPNNLQY